MKGKHVGFTVDVLQDQGMGSTGTMKKMLCNNTQPLKVWRKKGDDVLRGSRSFLSSLKEKNGLKVGRISQMQESKKDENKSASDLSRYGCVFLLITRKNWFTLNVFALKRRSASHMNNIQ